MATRTSRMIVRNYARRVLTHRKLRLFVPALLGIAVFSAACGSSSDPSASPSSEANALITQGLKAENHGQYQQALTDFSSATQKNPDSAIAYYDLGVLYQEHLNNQSEAAAEYNKALLADPKYRPAMFNLAIAVTPTNPQQAINLYDQLLKVNPNDANANFNLGLLLIGQNQSSQGHAALKKAIFIDPSLKSRVPAGITP
jgi:tetratricopeptide (TPR) repeat protein